MVRVKVCVRPATASEWSLDDTPRCAARDTIRTHEADLDSCPLHEQHPHPPHVPAHHAFPRHFHKRNRERPATHLPSTPSPSPSSFPPPSRCTRPAIACPAPAIVPAPSHHLLPSVPERTRLLIDLPPTCIPDPNPRHHNPVVGSRARVKSGLESRARARKHLPIALELPRFASAVGGPVVGMRKLGALAPRSPRSSHGAHPRGTRRHVRRGVAILRFRRVSSARWARAAQRIAVEL
jgi:hypothetical protein